MISSGVILILFDILVSFVRTPHDIFTRLIHGAQEELIIAEAQKVQDDTKKKKNMLVAESRCSHTEEQLGQACADRATLESSLREMADAKSAQERELRQVRNQLRPFLEKRGRDAYSQTEPEKRSCDLDRKLLKLEEDLERARASIVSSERNVFEKEQQLVESTARASKAMDDAQRNQKLAFSRQEKIDSLSKREQVGTEKTISECWLKSFDMREKLLYLCRLILGPKHLVKRYVCQENPEKHLDGKQLGAQTRQYLRFVK